MAEKAVERHPELAFFLGFMRRFDPSYAYAKEKIEAGASLVQIYSGFIYKGPALIRESVDAISAITRR